jgi:hypothetical protein
MQNTSHAVMAQRLEAADSPDDFPTPPWATRALIEHVLEDRAALARMSCLEPACGAGHMAEVLKEYFHTVTAADAYYYGYGPVRDFLTYPYEADACDWVLVERPSNTPVITMESHRRRFSDRPLAAGAEEEIRDDGPCVMLPAAPPAHRGGRKVNRGHDQLDRRPQ